MDKIYIIAVFSKDNRANWCNWGWFGSFEEAQLQLLSEHHFMLELGYYDSLMIEEVDVGICPISMNQWWYKYSSELDFPISVPKPIWAKNICNFTLG
jgi:hypothetical protein